MIARTKKKIEMLSCTHIYVTSGTNGSIVFNLRMDNGECRQKELQPREAVQVWRRMMGETDKDLHIFSPRLDVKYNDEDDSWTFSDDEVLCVLDLDECMLVAWAIEKACGIELCKGPATPLGKEDDPDKNASDVWLLVSASRPGPFSGEKGYCKSIGVNAMAFSSREGALNGLRELIREEVKKSHYSTNWEDSDDCRTAIDNIVDNIVESGNCVWMYDGTRRSFSVELFRKEVK